jgi:ankyrin repeat protein
VTRKVRVRQALYMENSSERIVPTRDVRNTRGPLYMPFCLVDRENNFGFTALHCGAFIGSVESVALLVSAGANIEVRGASIVGVCTNAGRVFLVRACDLRAIWRVFFLLSIDCLDAQLCESICEQQCSLGVVSLLPKLVAYTPGRSRRVFQARDSLGRTPLVIARKYKWVEVADILRQVAWDRGAVAAGVRARATEEDDTLRYVLSSSVDMGASYARLPHMATRMSFVRSRSGNL